MRWKVEVRAMHEQRVVGSEVTQGQMAESSRGPGKAAGGLAQSRNLGYRII